MMLYLTYKIESELILLNLLSMNTLWINLLRAIIGKIRDTLYNAVMIGIL